MATKSARPYLDELDRFRIITALSVVAVHVFAHTDFLDTTAQATLLQNAALIPFHYTREAFMFVTAFALVYVYGDGHFTAKQFWRKRSIGVLIPYAFWTVVYLFLYQHPTSFIQIVVTLGVDLVTGNAAYQLYFILLTIQFYIIFPWVLRLLPTIKRHPWATLIVSGAVELALVAGVHYGVPALPIPTFARGLIAAFCDRFVLSYQFYFIIGMLAALYLPEIRALLSRHAVWVVSGFFALLLALEAQYLLDMQIAHASLGFATQVLQPVMVPYSFAIIALMYWAAYRQATRVRQLGLRWGQRIWHALSQASYGVYLVHPIFLSLTLAWVIHPLSAWPAAALVPLAWALTAAGSVTFTLLLLEIPVLSRLVGRERPAAPKRGAVIAPSSLAQRIRAISRRAPARDLVVEQLAPPLTPPHSS